MAAVNLADATQTGTPQIGSGAGGVPLAVQQKDSSVPTGSPFSLSAAGTLFSLDTAGFESIAVQITSAGTGCTVSYEASNDNATWVPVEGIQPGLLGVPSTMSTAALILAFPCNAQYFRARVSTYGSGTVTARPVLRLTPVSLDGYVTGGQVSVIANAGTGALSVSSFTIFTAAAANAAVIKASAGRVYGFHFGNTSSAWRFVRLYNVATAPVPGTSAEMRIIAIPPGGSVSYSGDVGTYHSAGIGIAVTTTGAVNDATVATIAVGDVVGAVDFA